MPENTKAAPKKVPAQATPQPKQSVKVEEQSERASPKATKAPAKAPTKNAGQQINGLLKPMQISQELAAVFGEGLLPRAEVVTKVWSYIKAHNLQNPENRREILVDDRLKKVFGKDRATMFEMNKHLARHLT